MPVVESLGPRASRRALAALLAANVVSIAGGAVSMVALPWFVLSTTGSTVQTGLAAAAETVPLVAVALVAGGVVNRFGARVTRIGSDVISASTVLAVPALSATAGLAYWQLLALVAVTGAVRAPAPAASLVLLNALSAGGVSSPEHTRGAYSASARVAAAVGASLGGLLVAAVGAPAALVVDAASFAVSALVLTAVRRWPPRTATDATTEPAGAPPAGQRPWVGLTALARDRLLGVMSVLLFVVAVLDGAWATVLAPAYGQRVLHDAAALGLLLGVFGVGAVAGNLASAWAVMRVDGHRLVWACLAVGAALRYAVLGTARALPVLVGVMFLAGLAIGLLGPLWLGVLSNRTRADLHGHVFGVTFALEQGGTALGALLGGLALGRSTLPLTLAGASVTGAALAVFAASAPSLRQLQRTG